MAVKREKKLPIGNLSQLETCVQRCPNDVLHSQRACKIIIVMHLLLGTNESKCVFIYFRQHSGGKFLVTWNALLSLSLVCATI